MAGTDCSVLVDAPPERVFELATDFAGAPGRIRGISRVEMLTDGPVGVGTRFRETRTMFGREASETMDVAEFDPPRSYALVCESHGARYRSVFRFVPEGGGTRVEMAFQVKPMSLAARLMSLMAPMMVKMVRKEMERDLADLKRAAEAG